MTIDVIIPVFKPDVKLYKLIKKLGDQTVLPNRIILANTVLEEGDCEKLKTEIEASFLQRNIPIDIYPVRQSDYDHAATRQVAAKLSDADAILFMTQDAIPYDNVMVQRLKTALEKGAGAAFARQIAYEDAPLTEKLTRTFNYPEDSYKRKKKDLGRYGIKAIFCSDTCMIYDRAVFERLGGFDREGGFAEDMNYAYKLLQSGGTLAYAAGARVYHSHDYSIRENYRRSFLLGVNQAAHPEIYKKLPSEKEGRRYVKYVLGKLKEHKKRRMAFKFLLNCAARYLGVLKGRRKKIRK